MTPFELHPTAFWASYGNFHSYLRPSYSDRPDHIVAFAQVCGDPSLKANLRLMQRRTVVDKTPLGNAIWGSVENEIAGWTIAGAHQPKLLAGVLAAHASEHPRFPVIQAWQACVRLLKPNLIASEHAEGRTYRSTDWTAAREDAVATLASLNREYPPQVSYLPPLTNGMDF